MRNKSLCIAFVIFLAVSVCLLAACGEDVISFSLNFIVDGETYATVSTAGNETIALPQNPTKQNYTFDGWYWDNGTWNTPFTANSLLDAPLSSDMSVYAKFTYTPPTTNDHDHTYSGEWTKDETHHWHASTCGHDVISGKAIHNWAVTYTLPATESTTGVTVYTCSVCGATKTETIPATSEGHVHTYSENWSKDEDYHWHAATCGHNLEKDKALHAWDRGVITHAATETREGIRTYTCSVCGATKEETIPATGETVTTATVTFNLNGGQTSSSTTPVTVESWDKNDFFFDVEKDGFNFRGWSCNGTKVFDEDGVLINDIALSPNMVFVAEYSNTAKLTITTNMPEAGEYSTGGEFAYNTEVDVFAHPNQGYAFVGWMYKNATLSNQEDYKYKMWDKDVEIVAQFKLADFKLSLSSNNAEKGLVFINPTGSDIYEVEKEKMVTYKRSVTIAAYSRTDTRFLGWFDENNVLVTTNAVQTFNMPNYDYSLTAKWDYFTISYELGGGTNNVNNPTEYTIETDTIHLLSPTKSGVVFLGWKSGEEIVTEINPALGKNVTLTATWSQSQYSISYEYNGGTASNASTYSVTTGYTLVVPTKAGYTFLGWTGSNGNVPQKYVTISAGETGNKSFVANWEIIHYNVSYTLNGGTNDARNPSVYTVEDGTISLHNPTKDHYTFKNWRFNGNTITVIDSAWLSDVVIEAIWMPTAYDISYTLDGGTNNPNNPANYTVETATFTLVAPTKAGYVFLGWTGSNGNTPQETVTIVNGSFGAKSYVANWEIIHYNVSYTLNGGTNDEQNPATCTVLDSIMLNNPSRQYYTFGGWYTESGFVHQVMTLNNITSDINLYAKWTPKEYSISYTLDGGTNAPSNPNSYTVETVTFTLVAPTKAGYVFLGWTGSNGNMPQETVTIENCSYGAKAYVANWEIIHYNVSYTLNSGTNDEQNPTTCTVVDSIMLKNPSRQYYTFDGWYTESGFVHQVTSLSNTTSNVNLYAKWTPIAYVITYSLNGGTNAPSNPASYTIESDDVIINAPTRNGYSFTGWSGTDLDGLPMQFTISSGSINDRAYTANWSLNTYSISYVLNNGQIAEDANPTSYTYEDNITLINPTRGEYYRFLGWYDGSTLVTTLYHNFYKDLTLVAKWECAFTLSGNTITSITSYGKTLSTFIIPSSLEGTVITRIGSSAFNNCTGLTSITIPDSVTSIGDHAFSGCTGLTSITIPDSVTSIEGSAFKGCTSLTSITIPDSVTSIGNYAFYDCTRLTSITIPDGVTSIGVQTFYNCYSLTSITIPDGVTSIGDYAFQYCDRLTSITIPDSLTSIGDGAFYYCTSLTSVTIPDSVTSIGERAFYYCTSLTSITYQGTITQWNAISKGSYWNNNTGSYKVYCTNGTINK